MHFCVDANDTVALPEEAEFTLKVSRGKQTKAAHFLPGPEKQPSYEDISASFQIPSVYGLFVVQLLFRGIRERRSWHSQGQRQKEQTRLTQNKKEETVNKN